jgi:uncharacterized repeat protein (TIGR01451 family)
MRKKTLLALCGAVSLTALIFWLPRTSAVTIPAPPGVGLADLVIEDVSPKIDNFPVSANLQQSYAGRMLSLAVSSDGERLYVGGFSGVWRSDDGGTTWRQLTRPQPAPGTDTVAGALFGATVYDLVVSPANKDLVLAATFRDGRAVSKIGVYRSTNGGDSWSLAHQFTCGGVGGSPVGQVVFAPDNPDLLYAAGGCAVAISRDGGMTWENKTLPGGGSVWHVAVAPQQGSIRRVYATGDNRFWYSEDGGETWFMDSSPGLPPGFGFFPSDFANSTGSQILAIEPGRPERVYMAVAGFANGPSYYHPSALGPDGNHCNTPIVYDNNLNGAFDAGESLLVQLYPRLTPANGAPLKHDSKLKFIDANSNNQFDSGEAVIFDRNNDSAFNSGDVTLAGANPADGAALKEDAKITHVDFGVDYAPRGCGEGSIWLGDYSGVVPSDPARRSAQWSQLPGPPTYFFGSTPSGEVYAHTKSTSGGYLLFFADESHVHVSAGTPTSNASWHRLDGRNASKSKQDGDLSNKLFVHVDPHALALSTDFNITLKAATGVSFPYNQNSVLDSFISGRIWMANDGGVYRSDDGGVNWKLGGGLSTLQPFSIFAGVALPGKPPALYFGVPDDDNFFTLDGGATWKDPVSDCGDCGEWASDPALPNRVLEFAGRDNPPGFGVYTNSPGEYPNAGDSSQRRAVPFPGRCSGGATPPCPSDQSYTGELVSDTAKGYRPVVLTPDGETPPSDGDYILIRRKPSGARVLLRTTKIRSITSAADWDTTATEDGPMTKAFQQGPDFLPEMSAANTAQAAGGHANPFFYVSDPDSTRGLWRWTKGATTWQRIVPAPDGSATIARRFFVDPYNPSRIYIIDADSIKRSEDAGNTWRRDVSLENAVTENGAFSLQVDLGPIVGQGMVIRDMVFDPSERGTRFAIGAAGVFFTLDGEHWMRLLSSTALPGYPVSAYFDRISDPANRALYVAVSGRSILKLSPIPIGADLSITKSVTPSVVETGKNLTYTINVANSGPDVAKSVTVTDILPPSTTFVSCAVSGGVGGACGGSGADRTVTFTSLDANTSATITIIAQVNCSTPDATVISNTATITAPTTDPNPDNNSAMAMNTAFNPPPTITCPADITVITPLPGDVSIVVNFPPPAVTDNCPGASVVCSPPSGASFPVGMTTVNCVVTDSGGATASCKFKVTVWDVSIQDDRTGDFLLFNSFTGDYSFTRCGLGGFVMEGIGKVTRTGCITKLTDDTRIISAEIDRCPIAPKNRGSASIKRPNPGTTFLLKDRNILNNVPACP